MKVTATVGLALTFVVAAIICLVSYSLLSGYGYYQVMFTSIHKDGIASFVGLSLAGLYLTYCRTTIPVNTQGILLFLGRQTGDVWSEGDFNFLPKPFFRIDTFVSVQSFTLPCECEGRSSDGKRMEMLATLQCTPVDVFWMAKMSEGELVEYLTGLAKYYLGRWMNLNTRDTLLTFAGMNVSSDFAGTLAEQQCYGVRVRMLVTGVSELDVSSQSLFDFLATQRETTEALATLRASFPGVTDEQLMNLFGVVTGRNMNVSTHIIRGNGGHIIAVDGSGV